MAEYRQKSFHYKEGSVPKMNGRVSLQDLLKHCFSAQPKPARRTQKLAADEEGEDSDEVVILYRTEHRNMSCGILQRFKAGSPVIATIMAEDADNYEIKQFLPPKTAKKERTEFAKNLLYFAVRENHVLLTQKPGFGTADLQSHFQWMFSKLYPGYKDKQAVLLLADHIPPQYQNKKLEKVKAISISTNPELHVHVDGDGTSRSKKVKESQSWVIDEDPLVEAVLKMLRSHIPGGQPLRRHRLRSALPLNPLASNPRMAG